jgi:GDP-4-dehydro-6-deoxy-D-mannose reductase
MRVWVTGAGGFVGRHLVRELARRGHEVIALMRSARPLDGAAEWVELDLMSQDRLPSLLERLRPEGVIHLAAQSHVRTSWEQPAETFGVNTIGTIHLLTALRTAVPSAKLLTVGSSEEYGLAGKSGEPLTEEHPCLPQNPYATSKLAMGQIALQLARQEGLDVVHVRSFNHFGPGQREGFVVSDFCSQIARIERGLQPPVLRVGDLSAKRDFTAVSDVVEAYALLLERDVEPGVYNVCSERPRSIQSVLDRLLTLAKVPIRVETDPARLRPSEVPLFVGSAEKIRRATGWRARTPWEDSLRETLEWWRCQV